MTTYPLPLGTWRKSSYSGNETSNCVEVADFSQSIAARDSKDLSRPALSFPRASWSSFISAVKAAETAN